MKVRRLIPLLAIFVLSFLFIACKPKDQGGLIPSTSQAVPPIKGHVLYISSYNPSFPTFDDQIKGLQRALADENITLDIEFMDAKRLPSTESQALFETSLRIKLEQIAPYDVIIVADDNAFQFSLAQQTNLFQKIPVVFLGVNDQALAKEQNSNPQITGVIEAIDPEKTIQVIQKLQPGLTEVFVIADGTITGQADLNTTRAVYPAFPDIKFTELLLTELTFPELTQRVSLLDPRQQAILLLAAYQDAAGAINLFDDSFTAIHENTACPIYHLWTHSLGQGVIGGHMVSHEQQGYTAGTMALQILKGTPVADIPVVETSPNQYFFDEHQLRRFGIDPLNLPPGSTIINAQGKVQQAQLGFYAVIVLLLLAETALIVYMISVNKHRRILLSERDLAITELTENKMILSGIFDNAPIIIILSDLDGNYFKANPLFEKTFGYEIQDAMERMRTSSHKFGQYKSWQQFQEQLFEQGSFSFEEEFQVHDGSLIPFRVAVTPILINDQTYLLTIGQNLNERKLLEEERQRAQFAVEFSSITIFLANQQGRITYANQYACQELGYSLRELLQMDVWQLESNPQYAFDQSSWMNDWDEFRRNRRLLFTTEYQTKDGDLIDVSVSSNYFEFAGQEFCWIFANNINRIKFAENEAIRARKELEHAYLETIKGWAKALELRDFETAGHTQRVSKLCLAFAHELHFTHEQTLDMERGSILHDIGKLGISDTILLKPGRLTPDERIEIEKHPMIGYNMLKDIPFLSKASLITRYHHEKWDGTGYPDRLAGFDIPLTARIFAIIDVWDALLSNRPYHAPWLPEEAETYMRAQSGKHFDPELLTIFFNKILPAVNRPTAEEH